MSNVRLQLVLPLSTENLIAHKFKIAGKIPNKCYCFTAAGCKIDNYTQFQNTSRVVLLQFFQYLQEIDWDKLKIPIF